MRDGTYAWNDFAEFIKAYDRVAALFRTEEDYALLTETYLRELAAVDTIYSEIIISPDHGDRIGLAPMPISPASPLASKPRKLQPVSRPASSLQENAISVLTA